MRNDDLTDSDLLNVIEIIQLLQKVQDRNGFTDIVIQRIMPLLSFSRLRCSLITVDFNEFQIKFIKEFILVNYSANEFSIFEKFLPYWQNTALDYFQNSSNELVLANGVNLPADRFVDDKKRFLRDHPEINIDEYPCFRDTQWQMALSDSPDFSMAIGFLRDKSVGRAFSIRENRIAALIYNAIVSSLKRIALQEQLKILADVVNHFFEMECPFVVIDKRQQVVLTNSIAKKMLGKVDSDFFNTNILSESKDTSNSKVFYKNEKKYSVEIIPLGSYLSEYTLLKFTQITDRLDFIQENIFLRGLTDREGEVVMLLLGGLPTKEIAEKLCITMNTLKTHLKRIHYKFGTKTRTQLVSNLLSPWVSLH